MFMKTQICHWAIWPDVAGFGVGLELAGCARRGIGEGEVTSAFGSWYYDTLEFTT